MKRANPTIQLVNRCSNAVQPYIAGFNPSGLPSPGVLQPGGVKFNKFLCSCADECVGDATTYTFDQSFVGTIYGLESGVTSKQFIQAGFSLPNNYYWLVGTPQSC